MAITNSSLQTLLAVQKSFQRFGWADYIVFSSMLIGCSLIGVYYALKSKKEENVKEEDEYLMGGRNMSLFPIAMSLIASYISGITILGSPTEVYLHGTQYMFVVIGFFMTGLFASYLVVPVFHDLRLSSTNEYLRLRYDRKVQLLGSVLFTLSTICWLPIVIYVPALAFNQVTGVNVHVVTPVVCIICIFYTCIGGLKAVVWTDVVQTFLMVGSIVVIIVKGTLDAGGLAEVWRLNFESGRIELPDITLDPTVRHSIFSVTIGVLILFLQNGVVNQNMIQRFLTLPTKQMANRALWIFILGSAMLILICAYCGLLAYATYHDCDPITTGLAKAKEQVVPLLVMQALESYPGMPGLFVAGVFSAALSSLSTGLNSMAAVVLEDFIKPYRKTPLSEKAVKYILRGVVVIFGAVSVGLVFVVEQLGEILQLSLTLSAMANGAQFGIFIGGFLLPWINAKGALWGGLIGMSVSAIVVLRAQRAIAIGEVSYPNKPTSVTGCDYNFETVMLLNQTQVGEPDDTFPLYRLSYLFYTMFGGIITLIFAVLISYATNFNDLKDVDSFLVSPCIRRWLPGRKCTPEGKELLEVVRKD